MKGSIVKFVNFMLKQIVNMAEDVHINILVCARITLGGPRGDTACDRNCGLVHPKKCTKSLQYGECLRKKCFFITSPAQAAQLALMLTK